MSKPSIGTAVTPLIEAEKKQEIKELTVLEENSKESIYSLIFLQVEEGSSDKNE